MLCGSDPAIVVEDLSIRFRTTWQRKPTVGRRLKDWKTRGRSTRIVDALHEVSFEVPVGCFYGVIGRNGAGKSTLLKAIAGILAPAEGRIEVYGRATLLALGLGFNRELTGRENILLGGLAAGLDEDYVRSHVDEIVDLADIGVAIDYPMRTYSSGMSARLAFAVASYLDPEILLLDEVLSTGDARFRSKVGDRLMELTERDCTVVLVSHGLGTIREKADQCLWLENGIVFDEGPADEVVEAYLEREEVEEDESVMEDI